MAAVLSLLRPFCVGFATFCVLNILTGVFVENATRTRFKDRGGVIPHYTILYCTVRGPNADIRA